MWSSRAGDWVRITFRGSAIALVGPKGPTRGSAEIRLDGVKVRNVSAYSRTSATLRLLHASTTSPGGWHTLEVRVLATPGHPRFDIDGFIILP
jgi:hypothetical protein